MNYQRKEVPEVFIKSNYIFKVLYYIKTNRRSKRSNREIQIFVV
jgi:hypothetical protein